MWIFDNNTCVCVPAAYNKSNDCILCVDHSVPDAVQKACICQENNSVWVEDYNTCICANSAYFSEGRCITCVEGSHLIHNQVNPLGSWPNLEDTYCKCTITNTFWEITSNTCDCKYLTYNLNGVCVKCAEGSIPNDD